MFKQHDNFIDEIQPGKFLWKYIDFYKFFSIIKNQSLFFCKASLFYDSWEGSYPLLELQNLKKKLLETELKHTKDLNEAKEKANDTYLGFIKRFEIMKTDTIINCWSINSHENFALWKLYVPEKNGVVIKSNVENYKECFKNVEADVNATKIHYIDYTTDFFYKNLIPKDSRQFRGFNLSAPFVHKRKHFLFEDEYRTVIHCDKNGDKLKNYKTNDKGYFIPIDLNSLIDEIFVSPGSPKDYLEFITYLLESFGIDKKVNNSVLDDEPYKFLE